jgi:FtsZ-binding cell division protein ZapB
MSDPRLTAADVAMYAEWLDDERWDGKTAMRFVDSHEALRADVERLTAEHAALKTSDSQRVILEMLLSAIDTVLLGNEVSDFEESFPPVRQVIDLKDERDHLRAEHAALREEIENWKGPCDLCGGDCANSEKALVIHRACWNERADAEKVWQQLQETRAERDALREELAKAQDAIVRWCHDEDQTHTRGT